MKQGKGEEDMILKKATTKVKECVGKLFNKYINMTWSQIFALSLTIAGVGQFVINLFYSMTTFISTELSILFEARIVSGILLIIVAQLILLNENTKK